jgi:hypothetical protein
MGWCERLNLGRLDATEVLAQGCLVRNVLRESFLPPAYKGNICASGSFDVYSAVPKLWIMASMHVISMK